MRKYKNTITILAIIILLALTVSVSGCVGETNLTNKDSAVSGLIIKNLYTDPQQDLIQLGNSIKISYDIENVGGAKAEKVLTTIYGVSWMSDQQRKTDLCYPKTNCDPKSTTEFISPPDPISKISETKHVSFTIPTKAQSSSMKAQPEIPIGKSYKYPLTIRTSYVYDSSAITMLTGYSRKRYERDIQLGRQKMVVTEAAADTQQTISGTPIAISVSGPDRLIIPTPTVSTTSKSFTYHITFTNNGNGYPISDDELNTGLINGTMRIEGPGAKFEDCLGFKDATNITLKTKISDDNALILRGPSIVKSCTIKVEAGTNGWNQRDTDVIHIYFDLKYRYYIEKTFDITISSPTES